MKFFRIGNWDMIVSLTVCIVFCGLALAARPALAVTVGQVDEFSEDDYQSWAGAAAGVLEDVGPAGDGDFSLLLETSGFASGPGSRLVIYNGGVDTPQPTQWTGDWTAAGIQRLSVDVLNPNDFELNVWLGIAGPGPPGSSGSGDAYVSKQSAVIPADELWHTVEFSVLASDFDAWGLGSDPAAALADVYHMRIMHAPNQDWRGATGAAVMLIDNVRAIGVPEPSALLLVVAAGAGIGLLRRWRSVAT